MLSAGVLSGPCSLCNGCLRHGLVRPMLDGCVRDGLRPGRDLLQRGANPLRQPLQPVLGPVCGALRHGSVRRHVQPGPGRSGRPGPSA